MGTYFKISSTNIVDKTKIELAIANSIPIILVPTNVISPKNSYDY
jgi:hypothetical protein